MDFKPQSRPLSLEYVQENYQPADSSDIRQNSELSSTQFSSSRRLWQVDLFFFYHVVNLINFTFQGHFSSLPGNNVETNQNYSKAQVLQFLT